MTANGSNISTETVETTNLSAVVSSVPIRHCAIHRQHKDWDSADEFDSLTSNYERSGDTNQLAQQLNAFFNPMKEKDKER